MVAYHMTVTIIIILVFLKEYSSDLHRSGSLADTVNQHHGVEKQPLILPVPKDYFVTIQVLDSTTLTDFCKKHGLGKKLSVFLEVSQTVQKPDSVRDVLLMDKVVHYCYCRIIEFDIPHAVHV